MIKRVVGIPGDIVKRRPSPDSSQPPWTMVAPGFIWVEVGQALNFLPLSFVRSMTVMMELVMLHCREVAQSLCLSVFMCVCVCIYMCVYICTCVCVCVCVSSGMDVCNFLLRA